MSHLRFYRAILSHELADADAATIELHAATLSRKQTRPLFPFHDPPSQTQFQNDEIVPYLIFFECID